MRTRIKRKLAIEEYFSVDLFLWQQIVTNIKSRIILSSTRDLEFKGTTARECCKMRALDQTNVAETSQQTSIKSRLWSDMLVRRLVSIVVVHFL